MIHLTEHKETGRWVMENTVTEEEISFDADEARVVGMMLAEEFPGEAF